MASYYAGAGQAPSDFLGYTRQHYNNYVYGLTDIPVDNDAKEQQRRDDRRVENINRQRVDPTTYPTLKDFKHFDPLGRKLGAIKLELKDPAINNNRLANRTAEFKPDVRRMYFAGVVSKKQAAIKNYMAARDAQIDGQGKNRGKFAGNVEKDLDLARDKKIESGTVIIWPQDEEPSPPSSAAAQAQIATLEADNHFLTTTNNEISETNIAYCKRCVGCGELLAHHLIHIGAMLLLLPPQLLQAAQICPLTKCCEYFNDNFDLFVEDDNGGRKIHSRFCLQLLSFSVQRF